MTTEMMVPNIAATTFSSLCPRLTFEGLLYLTWTTWCCKNHNLWRYDETLRITLILMLNGGHYALNSLTVTTATITIK